MNKKETRESLAKGIEEFLSHYPPFLRHLVFPGLCSLVLVAVILLLAIVGSCMNCAGTCAYMGNRLLHTNTECSVGLKSASGYLGSTGGCCYWDVFVEGDFLEIRFDCGEGCPGFIVVVMSPDGSMVVGEYPLEETTRAILFGPADYRVVIFAEDGYGPWSAEWD
jgi:hypothetical protein